MTASKYTDYTIRYLFLSLIVILCLGFVLMFLPEAQYRQLLSESGPIENGSALGYVLGFIWLTILSIQHRHSGYFASGCLVLCLALRELDFNTRFTTMGIFKTRYYLSDKVPFAEKIIVSVIVAILIVSIALYLARYGMVLIRAMHQRESWAICVTLAIIFAVITKTLDRCNVEISRFVSEYLHFSTDRVWNIAEETLELEIPVLILIAIMSIQTHLKIQSLSK